MAAPKNDLEQLMDAAYEDNERLGEFYSALLSSDLFILTGQENVVEGQHTLPEGSKVSVMNFMTPEGTAFVPIFTSLQEMQRSVDQDYSYMGVNGYQLFLMTQGTDIVINPANEKALMLPADYVRQLLENVKFEDQ